MKAGGDESLDHMRNILAAISSDAFADNSPLAAIIARYVTWEMLAGIAREYAKGRLLLIGTTDLDARQPVVWNMDEIASKRYPRNCGRRLRRSVKSTIIESRLNPLSWTVDSPRRQLLRTCNQTIGQAILEDAFSRQDQCGFRRGESMACTNDEGPMQ
jgi:hypothetical protein